jgi:hypothetical protein
MPVHTSAGTKISIGGTSAGAILTDTYTEIKEVKNIGEFGRSYQEITHDSLGARGTQKFKGQYNDGNIALVMGRDPLDAGQAKVLLARDTDFDYNFKVEENDKPAATSGTCTITIAAPGVITLTAHGYAVNDAVVFSTTGALPTGLTAGTTYYVKTTPTADTFTVAATVGGAAITTSGTQSGVHTVTDVPANTITYFRAKVMSYTKNVGGPNQTVDSSVLLAIQSGTITEVAGTV